MPEWAEWLEICAYTGWTPEGPLQPLKYHKHVLPFNARFHVGVQWYNELTEMINNIEAVRIAIVGPAGRGKTYMGMHLANILESRRFTVEQLVLSGSDYLHLADTLAPKKCIVLDEPTYFASARSWQDKYQRLVVRTLESSRFQNNPIFIPIVNRNLLDKVIREYYLTHVLEMKARGIGRVYKTHKDQWSDTLYRNRGSLIGAFYPGVDLARCGRKTCLRCPELSTCMKYIWPQYERKREEAIKLYRAEDQKLMDATTKQTSGEAFRENCDRAWSLKDTLLDAKGKFNIPSIRYHLVLNRTDAQMIAKFLNQRLSRGESLGFEPEERDTPLTT